jgi:hypothetical protein
LLCPCRAARRSSPLDAAAAADALCAAVVHARGEGAAGTCGSSAGGEVSGQPLPGNWARGEWGGRMDFTATGNSPAALVAGLAGTGAVQLRSVTLPQADPLAPARVIAEAESGKLYISENDFMGALRRELDKASLTLATRRASRAVSCTSMRAFRASSTLRPRSCA